MESITSQIPGAFPTAMSSPPRRRGAPATPKIRVFSDGSTRGYGLTDEDVYIDSPPQSPTTKRRSETMITPPDSTKRPRARKFALGEYPGDGKASTVLRKRDSNAALSQDLTKRFRATKYTAGEHPGDGKSPVGKKRVTFEDEVELSRKKQNMDTQTPAKTGRSQMPLTPPSTIFKRRMGATTTEDISTPINRVKRKVPKDTSKTPETPVMKRKVLTRGVTSSKHKKRTSPIISVNPNIDQECVEQYFRSRGIPIKSSKSSAAAPPKLTNPATTTTPKERVKRQPRLPRLSVLATPPTTDDSATPSPTLSTSSFEFSRKRKFEDFSDEDTECQESKRRCSMPSTSAEEFGLLYEKLARNPFMLTFVANFLAKGRGKDATLGLEYFLSDYPTAMHIARANWYVLEREAWKVPGFYGVDAHEMCNFAKSWVHQPPRPGVKKNINIYERGLDGQGWEVGHIAGIGGHAIDVWRIWCRDDLLGVFEGMLAKDGTGEAQWAGYEWMRVTPDDTELRRYLRWRWRKMGFTKVSFSELARLKMEAAMQAQGEKSAEKDE